MDERGERWGCPESTDRGLEGRDELAAEAPTREAWTVGDPAGRRTGEVMARYVFTTHKNKMVRSDDGDDGGTRGGRNRDSLGHDAER